MPELIGDGKYDGKGRKIAPLEVALHFQTVETAIKNTARRSKGLGKAAAFKIS